MFDIVLARSTSRSSGSTSTPAATQQSLPSSGEDGPEHVVGFGSLSPFRSRPAYATTVENSVYVLPGHQGGGIGRMVLDELLRLAETHGFHSMIARITGTTTRRSHCTPRAGSRSWAPNARSAGSSAVGSTWWRCSACSRVGEVVRIASGVAVARRSSSGSGCRGATPRRSVVFDGTPRFAAENGGSGHRSRRRPNRVPRPCARGPVAAEPEADRDAVGHLVGLERAAWYSSSSAWNAGEWYTRPSTWGPGGLR